MTRCGCHDAAVFGHQEGCTAGLGPGAKPYRDWKVVVTQHALDARLQEMRAQDIQERRTMPRGKYAVTGGWLKKRG